MRSKWILLGALVTATAWAQMDPNMDMGAPPTKPGFALAMNIAMKKMDHDMAAAPMNGDDDHDFVTMMIPHHQGAVDMAKGELLYGKDPAMRRLAQEIVADQQSEIQLMNLWLKKQADAESKK